jgi:hypothetical protein
MTIRSIGIKNGDMFVPGEQPVIAEVLQSMPQSGDTPYYRCRMPGFSDFILVVDNVGFLHDA